MEEKKTTASEKEEEEKENLPAVASALPAKLFKGNWSDTAKVQDVVETVLKQQNDEKVNTLSAEEAEARERKESRLMQIIQTAFSYMEANVLTNSLFLRDLRKKKKLFVEKQERGSWFVIFSAETCMRFMHAVDQMLPRKELHLSLLDTEQLFDWDNMVFFVPLSRYRNYIDIECIVYDGMKPGDVVPPHLAEMRAKLQEGCPFFECMTTTQLSQLRANMVEMDPKKGEMVCTLMCLDRSKKYAATQTFTVNTRNAIKDEYRVLKRLAAQYFIEMLTCESALVIQLGMADGEGLSEEERAVLRQVSYAYARSVLLLNNVVQEDKEISPAQLVRAMDTKNAPCGYCSKENAAMRCRKCLLFRYCDEQCLKKHVEEGIEGVLEQAKAAGTMPITHMHYCNLTRAAVRLWGQVPLNIRRKRFNELMDEARELYQAAVYNGAVKLSLTDNDTGEEIQLLEGLEIKKNEEQQQPDTNNKASS